MVVVFTLVTYTPPKSPPPNTITLGVRIATHDYENINSQTTTILLQCPLFAGGISPPPPTAFYVATGMLYTSASPQPLSQAGPSEYHFPLSTDMRASQRSSGNSQTKLRKSSLSGGSPRALWGWNCWSSPLP